VTAATIALTLATVPFGHAETTPLAHKIADARQQTWACEDTLGIRRTPASSKPVQGVRYSRWVLRLWTERARSTCRVARDLTSAGVLRQIVDRCLAGIIELENHTWDPTVDYGWGHGNVNEAYGIPQANPGTKMASAGPDWRTNPLTQLRWMAKYARDRYGSNCAAYHHRITVGYY
jgi:hypothetical protein